jgi:VanZ family protein
MLFHKYFWPSWAWLAIVTWLSVTPGVQMPKFELLAADKLAHAGAYALLSLLLVLGLVLYCKRLPSRKELFLIACFSAAYGAVMEFVQGTFFPYRFFEWDDMLANTVGAFIATILASFLPIFRPQNLPKS